MLAAARQGSNRAWAALIKRLDPDCRRLAHLVLGGHGVDGVLLSAYVRAFRARRTGSEDAFVFLSHHVWIACGHEVRRRQRRTAPAPGRRAERDELSPRFGPEPLARVLSGLRPEERAVWGLIDQAGLPVAAVSEALGVGEGAVTAVAKRLARTIDDAMPSPEDDLEWPAPPAAPDLDHVGEDTEAVLVTESATENVPPADDDESVDPDGSLDPDPVTAAFWAELGRRLRAEREAPSAAPPPVLPEPGEPSPSLAKPKAPPVAMQKRAPAKSRRGRPDLVEELAEEADRQKPQRDWGPFLIKAAAVLVVVGLISAVVYVLFDAASDAKPPVRGESVAASVQRTMEVLAEAGTWSATVERISLAEAGQERASLRVIVAADGSYRIQDTSQVGRLTTFDAATLSVQDTATGFPPRSDRGAPFGEPDVGGPPRAGTPIDDIGIAARALASITDREPERTTHNGQPVLRLDGELDDGIDLALLVDASTRVPVRITWTAGEEMVREVRFADFTLDALAPEFSQNLPPEVVAQDLGWAPVRITEIAARTQLTPLTPNYLPDGFVPSGVAVHEQQRIATLRYARGPEEILVTLRPSPVEAGNPWDDPFPRSGSTTPPTASNVSIEDGPFRGVTAQQVTGPRELPSIWGANGEVAFTVSGDLSSEDLVRVARSLRAS